MEIGVVVNPEAVVMLSQLSSGFVSFPYSSVNINCNALFRAKRRILLGTWSAILRTEADFQTYWLLFDDRLCQSLCRNNKSFKRNTQIFAHRFNWEAQSLGSGVIYSCDKPISWGLCVTRAEKQGHVRGNPLRKRLSVERFRTCTAKSPMNAFCGWSTK